MPSIAETIHFHLASVTLTGIHKDVLARFVAGLVPGATVEVEAHACSTPVITPGSLARYKDNQGFSEARAAVVRDHLLSIGLAPGFITTKALGSTRPLGAHRDADRRVHLIVNLPYTN